MDRVRATGWQTAGSQAAGSERAAGKPARETPMSEHVDQSLAAELPIAVLDVLPNPVLVKDHETRYVWVNEAFERLFQVDRRELAGRLDKDVFTDRQVAQCNGGDLRVLETGRTDEAYETVVDPDLGDRETITRKSRLELGEAVYLVGVMHDVTELSRINEKLADTTAALASQAEELRTLAASDSLTKCMNRRALFESAPRAFRQRGEGAVVLLDLDFFKAVNDAHGHAAGDAALVHFVEVVTEVLRTSDWLARLGGEEFVAVLPGASAAHTAVIAERIRAAVEATPLDHEGVMIPLTVSAGAVHRSVDDGLDLDDWMAEADRCLYEAKSNGRNGFVVS